VAQDKFIDLVFFFLGFWGGWGCVEYFEYFVVLNVFPNMFPITPHFVPYALPKVICHFGTYVGGHLLKLICVSMFELKPIFWGVSKV